MPPLVIAALAAAGVGAATKIGSGLIAGSVYRKQQKEGKSMIAEGQKLSASYLRPEMQTPEAIEAMGRMAQGQMFQNMPGNTQINNQIQQSTAAGLSAIGEQSAGAEGIGSIAQLYQNQMGQQQQQGIANAGFRQEGANNFMDTLQNLGQYQEKNWMWNKADPYMQAQRKAAEMETMGRQMQFQGYKGRAGVASETIKGIGDTFDKDFFTSLLSKP